MSRLMPRKLCASSLRTPPSAQPLTAATISAAINPSFDLAISASTLPRLTLGRWRLISVRARTDPAQLSRPETAAIYSLHTPQAQRFALDTILERVYRSPCLVERNIRHRETLRNLESKMDSHPSRATAFAAAAVQAGAVEVPTPPAAGRVNYEGPTVIG
jgi:hypothetical protein